MHLSCVQINCETQVLRGSTRSFSRQINFFLFCFFFFLKHVYKILIALNRQAEEAAHRMAQPEDI